MKGHSGDVNSVALSPDSSKIASGSDDEGLSSLRTLGVRLLVFGVCVTDECVPVWYWFFRDENDGTLACGGLGGEEGVGHGIVDVSAALTDKLLEDVVE